MATLHYGQCDSATPGNSKKIGVLTLREEGPGNRLGVPGCAHFLAGAVTSCVTRQIPASPWGEVSFSSPENGTISDCSVYRFSPFNPPISESFLP